MSNSIFEAGSNTNCEDADLCNEFVETGIVINEQAKQQRSSKNFSVRISFKKPLKYRETLELLFIIYSTRMLIFSLMTVLLP